MPDAVLQRLVHHRNVSRAPRRDLADARRAVAGKDDALLAQMLEDATVDDILRLRRALPNEAWRSFAQAARRALPQADPIRDMLDAAA